MCVSHYSRGIVVYTRQNFQKEQKLDNTNEQVREEKVKQKEDIKKRDTVYFTGKSVDLGID